MKDDLSPPLTPPTKCFSTIRLKRTQTSLCLDAILAYIPQKSHRVPNRKVSCFLPEHGSKIFNMVSRQPSPHLACEPHSFIHSLIHSFIYSRNSH